ncbi:MAG: DUF4157 domain-containing protein, partial [Geobacter sp.]|nr:DUF4157 domain-containing protein [Geobacter sp.]
MTARQTSVSKQTDQAARKQDPTRLTAAEVEAATGSAGLLALHRAADNPASSSLADSLKLQRRYGNRAVQRLIQAKLKVGAAMDRYEQEADHIADQVMRKPALTHSPSPSVRPRADDEDDVAQRKPQIQRIADDGGFEADSQIEDRISRQRGRGQPLSDQVRTDMESRFGADFSRVQLHTDGEAGQLNRELSAEAFTHGQDIYLGTGKYDPRSANGQRLLAHELTHVVQQTGGQLQRHTVLTAKDEDVQRFHAAPSMIQRHGSAEHMLLGEVDPKSLSQSALPGVKAENRLHALHQELKRSREWHQRGPLTIMEGDG